MGHGAITYWKDGREVYDNVSCLYVFDDGVKMTFDSVISNQFYGLEEQIMEISELLNQKKVNITLKVSRRHPVFCK